MVEGNVPSNNWPKFGLQKMQDPVVQAREAKKYLFIWDKQGSVGTFLQYKGQLAPLGPEVLKASLGRQTAADVGEYMRR